VAQVDEALAELLRGMSAEFKYTAMLEMLETSQPDQDAQERMA
jgi:hypothetical protein